MGGNPWTAPASRSPCSPSSDLPVLPFLLTTGTAAIAASIALALWLWPRSASSPRCSTAAAPGFSAARQVLFGCAAAGVTYGVGALLGVSLS